METRNEADAAVHNTKKNLDEHKSNLPQEVQDDVQTKIVEVEQVLANEDASAEEIRTSVDELQQAAMKMGEAIYKSQGGSVPSPPLPCRKHACVGLSSLATVSGGPGGGRGACRGR